MSFEASLYEQRWKVCIKQPTIQPPRNREIRNGRRKNPYQTPTRQKRKEYRQAKVRHPQEGHPIGPEKQAAHSHRVIQQAQQWLEEQIFRQRKLVRRNG